MNDPIISVIVPVYKTEAYLRKCLDSIAAQTYKNLEIILVDDGSPDGSGAICDEYAAKDARFTVIHTQNRGQSKARNTALEAAHGELIGFIDSDDWIEPRMFEYLYSKAIEFSADAVQCGVFFDEPNSSELMYCPPKDLMLSGSVHMLGYSSLHYISPSVWCKLYKSHLLKNIRFDPDCTMSEDYLFNLQVLRGNPKMLLCSEAMYHYVQRSSSMCYAPPTLSSVRSQRRVFKEAGSWFDKGTDLYAFLEVERLKLDMHNCSRIVQNPHWEIAKIKSEIRMDVRRNALDILKNKMLSPKDKGKLFLIGWAWWLYRVLLLESKKNKNIKRV